MPEDRDQKRHRYKIGALALSAVILIWVSSSFVMNNMFANLKYNKPFMITYINTTTFSLYLLPYLFNLRNNNSKASSFAQHTATAETEIRLLGNEDLDNDAPDTMYEIENEPSKLSTAETIRLALTFCLLWFMANYTTNASLAYTSVTSSTILSSMSEKFELPFSTSIWIMIFLNAFVGTFMSDYLWLLAMLMTSPLVVTLGVSLTIPLAVAGDAVFTHVVPGLEYALGAILVIAGFFVVNMATLKNDWHFRQANDQQSNENEASPTQALHTSSRLASNDGPRGGLYK
ncbi:Putative Solute carrier family 35 member F5 [Rhizopus microsporus]|nr:Putative Solute carrier family 35 member F5 [Rhizopus microsporus]